jgi:hypothetical protein
MSEADPRLSLEQAFDRIEETILPSLSTMLDALLHAATAARAGEDADIRAAELRNIALQLEELTRQVEATSHPELAPDQFRPASAA